MNTLREELYQACYDFVLAKEERILTTIRSHQVALNSETKSSAGDKHETGRAMLQLEMEKASQQLEVVHKMKLVLAQIDPAKVSELATLGSLVITNLQNFYLSVSAGELMVAEKPYYAVSVHSPIGKLLIGKKAGDVIQFRQEIKVEKIY